MIPHSLPEVFSLVAAISWRVGLLVLLLAGLRRFAHGRVPAQLWFGVWVVVALRLLIPLGVPVPARVPAASAVATSAVTASQPLSLVAMATAPLPASAPVEPEPSSMGWAWQEWLPALWLAGVVILGGTRILASWRFRRQLRQAAPVVEPRWLALVTEEARATGVGREVASFETEQVDAPALSGWWRPRLLLPVGLVEKLTEEEQRFVIRHELGHWRRRDLLTQALVQAAVVVHWFNPLAWLAARLARTDCELACDEHVLRRESPDGAEAYGAALLKVLDLVSERSRPLAVVGLLESRSRLADRIRRIAGYQVAGVVSRVGGVAVLGATAALAVLSFTREVQAVEAAVTPAPSAVPGSAPAPTLSAADLEQRAKLNAMQDSYRALNAVVGEQRVKVEKLAEQLQAFKERNGVTNLAVMQQGLAEQLRAQNVAYAQLRVDRDLSEVRQAQIKKAQTTEELLKIPAIAERPEVRAASLRREEKRAAYAALGERYLDRHPARAQAGQELQAARADLDRVTAEAVLALGADYQSTEAKVQQALSELNRLKKESLDLDRLALDYLKIERELKLQEQLLLTIAARGREVTAISMVSPSSGATTARPPSRPEPTTDGTLASTPRPILTGRAVLISGSVTTPGRYALSETDPVTLVDLIATAGGLTRIANGKKVRVSRVGADGKVMVWTLNVDVLLSGSLAPDVDALKFFLQPGDIVFVPEKIL